jgi:hypothetical protein
MSPGPAAYALQTHKSVYTNAGGKIVNGNQAQMSMTTLDSQGFYTSTFGNTYDKYKNVYHHEVSRDFQNREGPGPGKTLQPSNLIHLVLSSVIDTF